MSEWVLLWDSCNLLIQTPSDFLWSDPKALYLFEAVLRNTRMLSCLGSGVMAISKLNLPVVFLCVLSVPQLRCDLPWSHGPSFVPNHQSLYTPILALHQARFCERLILALGIYHFWLSSAGCAKPSFN